MKNKINKIPNLIWFTFLIIYSELIYKIFVFHNIKVVSMLRITFFSIPFIILFYLISNLYKEKTNCIVSKILSLCITVFYCAQFVYYAFYETIFSVYSLTTGTAQVMGFASMIISMILRNYVGFSLLFLPSVFYVILGHKLFSFAKYKKASNFIILFIGLASYIIGMVYINFFSKDGLYSLKNLYNNIHAPMITVNKVGLLTMEKLDIKRYLFGFEEKLYTDKSDVIVEDKKEYNILSIDFEGLISNESDENIKSLHSYFASVSATEKNKYTGVFKGKNLIYITAEGFDTIAISEELTPTLYKLSHNGFIFDNYYQPLYPISTSDGEYMNLMSFIPKEGIWSMKSSSNINYPYAIGNVYKNLGYVTRAYHNHTYTYYGRNVSHSGIGFDYLACGNGLEKKMNCKMWPSSDLDMINVTYEDYINENQFLVYYMTVSGHLNYTFVDNSQSKKNRNLVENLPYSNNVKAYIACQIELDRALEKLLQALKDAGKLDDTVIVLSPDHYPYGLTEDEINEVAGGSRTGKFDLYHSTLIIYNSAMKKNVSVDKYVTGIDILPTIYNLFGVEYDSRLLMGRDALSNSEGLVMLSDRSWINENGSYDSISGVYTPFNEEHNTNEYVDSINAIVGQKFIVSSLILSKKSNGEYVNYFKYLGL